MNGRGLILVLQIQQMEMSVVSLGRVRHGWLIWMLQVIIDEVPIGGSIGEEGRAIRQKSNGEFIFAGASMSSDGESDNHYSHYSLNKSFVAVVSYF